jgi:hypothetical protein
MHATRDAVFDAPAIHSDIVTRLPQGSIVTARNAMSEIQAAEIRLGRGVFWGVQYHPEYGLHDVAAVIRRYGQMLVTEGFSPTLPNWTVMRPICPPLRQTSNAAISPGGLGSVTTS